MSAGYSLLAAVAIWTVNIVDRGELSEGTQRTALTISNDGNYSVDKMLAIGCDRVGEGKLFVRYFPGHFYSPDSGSLELQFWEPSVRYGFGKDQPVNVTWLYDEEFVELNARLRRNEVKARFLDSLVKSNRLTLVLDTSEIFDAENDMITYSIEGQDLARVIQRCGPRRVIKYLEEWKSPAITGQTISD